MRALTDTTRQIKVTFHNGPCHNAFRVAFAGDEQRWTEEAESLLFLPARVHNRLTAPTVQKLAKAAVFTSHVKSGNGKSLTAGFIIRGRKFWYPGLPTNRPLIYDDMDIIGYKIHRQISPNGMCYVNDLRTSNVMETRQETSSRSFGELRMLRNIYLYNNCHLDSPNQQLLY